MSQACVTGARVTGARVIGACVIGAARYRGLVAPRDTNIALAGAEICARHRLAMADAIVYATALLQGADLLTCAAHCEGLPGVALVAKTGHGPGSAATTPS